tara:strand:- start:1350 stop:1703 length:354 start_codon:yes stop_codon:yes gene_type:complete
MKFLKIIFSWWHNQTFGTLLQTIIYGNIVGKDQFGNKYYQNKNDTKRWVVYNGPVDASMIPPEWHSWLHKIIKTTPDQIKFHDFDWQKKHKKNLTGTNKAYKPDHKKELPYNKWEPK